MFYFVRHGKTDYSLQNTKIYQSFGVNLSPLSEQGVAQIKETSKDERLKNADIVITSPYTRAVQTAAILSKELGVDIAVETDLHEWIANKNYIYETDENAWIAYYAYAANNGEYPDGTEKGWETASMIRKRVLKVLEKYKNYNKVIVTAHGMLIQAVTGCSHHPKNGEIIEYDMKEDKDEISQG